MPQDSLPLQPMADYVRHTPPREGWRAAEPSVVHLHPFQRITLQFERAQDIGYGLHRDEQLAEQGVFGAEADSVEFSKSLVQALAPELSIRNLQHLVEAFTAELADQEARRRTHLLRTA